MSKVTIRELAKYLSLSISTVSRALSDSHEIKAETRQKVKDLAQKLNYTPNVYASNLRSRKSKTIGVIIPEITNSFFSQAIDGIEEVAREKGYHVLIYLSHESYEQEVSISGLLMDGRVDGLLLSVSSSTANTDHIEKFRQRNVPVVLFDRVFESYNTLKVLTDDYESGVRAANHLIRKGCKHIAYTSLATQLSIDRRRKQGFFTTAMEAGVKYTEIKCHGDYNSSLAALSAVLKSHQAPDGIFSPVESLGMLIYDACEKQKVAIPEQLKVISFSNLKIAAFLNPPLTSISQPAFEMGQQACRALFKAINNGFFYDEEEVLIPSSLIERGST